MLTLPLFRHPYKLNDYPSRTPNLPEQFYLDLDGLAPSGDLLTSYNVDQLYGHVANDAFLISFNPAGSSRLDSKVV